VILRIIETGKVYHEHLPCLVKIRLFGVPYMIRSSVILATLMWASALCAQPLDTMDVEAASATAYDRGVVPAGTPVVLQMTQTVTTQGGSWQDGDVFSLKVFEDVMIGEYVVIPRDTIAFGHVRWSTGRGLFGKSGKIEIEIDYLILGDKEIRLAGVHRQAGRGDLRSVGNIAASGPFAPFITGESGEIGAGALVTAYLAESFGVAIARKPTREIAATTKLPVVRARQISVAEAFKADMYALKSASAEKVKARRKTVAEAFDGEFKLPE
jgi:hypothetical protein